MTVASRLQARWEEAVSKIANATVPRHRRLHYSRQRTDRATESIGHPALSRSTFSQWPPSCEQRMIKRRLDVALPKQGNNMQFAFMADHDSHRQEQ